MSFVTAAIVNAGLSALPVASRDQKRRRLGRPPEPRSSAPTPSTTQRVDDTDSMLAAAVGFAIATSMHSHSSPPADVPVSGGGGDFGGGGASGDF